MSHPFWNLSTSGCLLSQLVISLKLMTCSCLSNGYNGFNLTVSSQGMKELTNWPRKALQWNIPVAYLPDDNRGKDREVTSMFTKLLPRNKSSEITKYMSGAIVSRNITSQNTVWIIRILNRLYHNHISKTTVILRQHSSRAECQEITQYDSVGIWSVGENKANWQFPDSVVWNTLHAAGFFFLIVSKLLQSRKQKQTTELKIA